MEDRQTGEFGNSLHFVLYSGFSLFSAAIVETFSVLDIFKETGSIKMALGLVAIQMTVEVFLNIRLPIWLKRFGPAVLTLWSIPARILAFGLMLWNPDNLAVLVSVGGLLGLAACFSDVPRTVVLARWSRSNQRGLRIGYFEGIRYGAMVLAPLAGGYAFDFGGFLPVATISILAGLGSVLALLKLAKDKDLDSSSGEEKKQAHPVIDNTMKVPVQIRFLWWGTGLRYIAETAFYPILAMSIYGNTVSVGWIATISVLIAILMGFWSDRIPSRYVALISLVILSFGWIPRTQEVSFPIAIVLAVICAVGGKLAGMYEKKVTFEFGDRTGNSFVLLSRRESELLISRIVILLATIFLGLSSTIVLAFVIGAILFFGFLSLLIFLFLRTQIDQTVSNTTP